MLFAHSKGDTHMKDLFLSRKFLALLLALLAAIVAAFRPDFQVDADTAAAFAVVVVSYILGVAVDPGPGGWRGVIKSRKFYAALVGLVVIFLDAFHLVLPAGLTPEMLISLAVIIGGYIGGVAFEMPKYAFNRER
jgi:hypothetical protein